MLPLEIIRKLRRIRITAARNVTEVLSGGYRSAFKGTGMEFEEVREYLPGDEVRAIDWNVTARQGRPFLKTFREERELTVMFLVDQSASGAFGSSRQTKNQLAAEVCALLGFSAAKNNDKAGLLLFSDRVEKFISPGKGATHAVRLLQEILTFSPRGRGTDLKRALDYLGRVLPRRCVLFLISDFQCELPEAALHALARKHDVIAVPLRDRREYDLPNAGLVALEDAETGESLLIDTSSLAVRRKFRALAEQRQELLLRKLRSTGMRVLPLETNEDYARRLHRFFLNAR